MKSPKQEPGSTLYAAQTRRTIAAAERDELRNKVIKGELVKREAVEKEWFKIGRQVRDNLMNLPSRLAGLVASERSQEKCFQIIEAEVRQALEPLTGANP